MLPKTFSDLMKDLRFTHPFLISTRRACCHQPIPQSLHRSSSQGWRNRPIWCIVRFRINFSRRLRQGPIHRIWSTLRQRTQPNHRRLSGRWPIPLTHRESPNRIPGPKQHGQRMDLYAPHHRWDSRWIKHTHDLAFSNSSKVWTWHQSQLE